MTTLEKRTHLDELARQFGDEWPHTEQPFSRRNWGHSLHSLCSYQGKLKPSLAHFLVERFVPEAGSVIDPLGGVGTVALEAALSGRASLSNDLSPFAFTVASGKLDPPTLSEADAIIDELSEMLAGVEVTPTDFKQAEFGLNATVSDYYHPDTLRQILAARRLFGSEAHRSRIHSFVWACLLHVLHGNRPYALSRRSHPITPFSPTGPMEEKDLIESVRAKARRSLADELSEDFVPGTSIQGDFRDLDPAVCGTFDSIISSPPFLGMRFDRPNWLRLWFCGWDAESFHESKDAGFLERQQMKDRDCYREFFESCHRVIDPSGVMVLHVGSGSKGDLAADLIAVGEPWFELEADVIENVSAIERHGMPDKSLTTRHHLLFLVPR